MAWLLNHFNFKKCPGSVLLTNDEGHFMFLNEADFDLFVRNPNALSLDLTKELESRMFLTSQQRELFASNAALKVRQQKSYLLSGTQLHIFVLTRRCNQSCVYCQASAKASAPAETDMQPMLGERAVNIALQSPAHNLSFEFQGGEPTLNFATLRHIVEYANEIKGDRQILYSLVTNLASIDDYMLAFLAEHGVSITTSLDGPRDLHIKNRPFTKDASFDSFVANIERARRAGCTLESAIETTTRYSLGYARDIVDTFVSLGFKSIFIRPLTPIGFAKLNWEKIGYEAREFVAFYDQCLRCIFEQIKNGTNVIEVQASVMLKRILNVPGNYMELRSPCGATTGQIAYNVDGSIYPCDEARMLAEIGDWSFKIGDVTQSNLKELIESPVTKSVSIASCLEVLPSCSECVYMPYCGVCPVVSYAHAGTLFPQRPGDYRCALHKGMLDTLFSHLRSDEAMIRYTLEKWAF